MNGKKLLAIFFSLAVAVLVSACVGKETTGESLDETDDVVEATSQNDTEEDTTVVKSKKQGRVVYHNTRTTTETSSDDDDDEEDGTTSSSNDPPSPPPETTSSPTTPPTTSSPNGDSNVQLSSYEGPRNVTIKYSASSFEPSETVEIRMTGLYYTAATFYSHDGTVPPSDLYIPYYDSSGSLYSGTIEIKAKGSRSGREFTAYYTITSS